MFSKQDLNWFFKNRAAVINLVGMDRCGTGQSTAAATPRPEQQPAKKDTYYTRNQAICQAKSRLYYWTNRETRLTYQRDKRKSDICLAAVEICDKIGNVDE